MKKVPQQDYAVGSKVQQSSLHARQAWLRRRDIRLVEQTLRNWIGANVVAKLGG